MDSRWRWRRRQRLIDIVQRGSGSESLTHAFGQRVLSERHGDHEMSFDKRRIANRQDIGVLKFRREPSFALEVGEGVLVHGARMGYLQRNLNTVNGIESLIDGRDGAVRNAPLDSILAESLSCS